MQTTAEVVDAAIYKEAERQVNKELDTLTCNINDAVARLGSALDLHISTQIEHHERREIVVNMLGGLIRSIDNARITGEGIGYQLVKRMQLKAQWKLAQQAAKSVGVGE